MPCRAQGPCQGRPQAKLSESQRFMIKCIRISSDTFFGDCTFPTVPILTVALLIRIATNATRCRVVSDRLGVVIVNWKRQGSDYQSKK